MADSVDNTNNKVHADITSGPSHMQTLRSIPTDTVVFRRGRKSVLEGTPIRSDLRQTERGKPSIVVVLVRLKRTVRIGLRLVNLVWIHFDGSGNPRSWEEASELEG